MSAKKMKKALFVLLCTLGFSAYAQQAGSDVANGAVDAKVEVSVDKRVDDAMDARIRAAIKQINPELVPDYIGRSPVPGFLEVIIKGQVVFVTDDGNYLVQGLMDLRDRRDVAQFGAMPGRRLEALNATPVSERIVFAPEGPTKHTVSVFTDVECGFCRKLHQDIAEYNKLGIAIEYLAYPRAGLGSPDAVIMESVWCSDDRRKALTDAKSGVAVAPRKCENPVAKQHAIGESVGLRGTPFIVNADGIGLPGYLPPEKLLEELEKLAVQRNVRP